MEQETVTLIVAGLGIIGTLGGIVVGHLLTRSWQRKQWILDCKKEEFRELVSALTGMTIDYILYFESQNTPALRRSLESLLPAHELAYKIIADRIYIAKDIEKMKVADRYLKITDNIRQSEDKSPHLDEMGTLISVIVEFATRG